MGKKSIIATLLALALVLMGTAYAYWTDNLNITTKATTGDLDVTFIDLGLFAQYSADDYRGWSIIDGIEADGFEGFIPADFFTRDASDYNIIAAPGTIDQYTAHTEGYSNVTFGAELIDPADIGVVVGPYPVTTKGSDNIEVTIDNIYPGYAQAFRTDIANIGTIAAKLASIKFGVSALEGDLNENMKNEIGVALYVSREYQEGDEVVDVFKLCNSLGTDAFFELGGVHFVRLSALEDVSFDEIANQSLLIVPNNNRMDAFFGFAMDPDAEGAYTSGTAANISGVDDELTEEKGVVISMDFSWGQFNELYPSEVPANALDQQN